MTEPRWFRDEESFGVYDDDGEVIARNLYRDVQLSDGTKQRVFPGIHVRPDHRHVGLAAQLTKHSMDTTIQEGYRIVPICPYVAQWMREYDDGAYLKYRDEPAGEHFFAD
ncbi:GNAT family N-acetyltransferase [Enteractinococcus helveticum]|uniref:N-acetyltransferase domain-containing protein n=1 Tax=Enteractinococcus helveticum TaxID=1837282 RepID=A0A1B7M353_9MICC|nr:N-acetyltransferase [Enteractinococcus helveticum]OAV63026.1 hypothetical protein A6F49_03625 [Enteractinococcus helveticum]